MAKKKKKLDVVAVAKEYVWLIVIGVVLATAIIYFSGVI